METFWLHKKALEIALGSPAMSVERSISYVVENATSDMISAEICGKERLVHRESFLVINSCGREEILDLHHRAQFGGMMCAELARAEQVYEDLPCAEVSHEKLPAGLTAGWATSNRKMHTFFTLCGVMLFDPVSLRGRFISREEYEKCWKCESGFTPLFTRDMHLAMFGSCS